MPDTQFDRAMATVPNEHPFEITPLPADTTTETWNDTDTNIGDGEAWLIYGFEYQFEYIDPTVPMVPMLEGGSWSLQFHRNDDSELLIGGTDDDLLMMDHFQMIYVAESCTSFHMPFVIDKRTITTQPTLREIWRTDADIAVIAATMQIAGKIFYDKVGGAPVEISKFGNIAGM